MALVFQDSVAWTEVAGIPASGYLVSKVTSHNMVSSPAVASKIKALSAEIFLQILWSAPFHPVCQARVQMDASSHVHTHTLPHQPAGLALLTNSSGSEIGRWREDIRDFLMDQGQSVNIYFQF